ncbi:hypothetical protein DSO57_1001478 [Entomophthora muscae]|uniref:Uncharacterized protein n=1 Tax=Entomophthora muscae TaxID=34485 RepID=A0ACC2UJY8_9FUNG|nr:hypothetical protein DSO57_1001478 [Entomophthora muscae]
MLPDWLEEEIFRADSGGLNGFAPISNFYFDWLKVGQQRRGIVKFCGPLLALDWDVFSRPLKKVARVQANPLQNLEDLAHTVDESFVLAFMAEVPISPLESPPTAEETLIQLDCLLSWCWPVLKQLAGQQKNAACMNPEKPNLQPGEIGYQILQSVASQAANSPGPEVPQTKIIGFWSSPMETSEEGIRGNAHPESSEGS